MLVRAYILLKDGLFVTAAGLSKKFGSAYSTSGEFS
jgi:hypothetical protein